MAYDKDLAIAHDEEYIRIVSRTCKCGHVINLYDRSGYAICRWCGNIVFLTKKAEYDYKIKRRYANGKISNPCSI